MILVETSTYSIQREKEPWVIYQFVMLLLTSIENILAHPPFLVASRLKRKDTYPTAKIFAQPCRLKTMLSCLLNLHSHIFRIGLVQFSESVSETSFQTICLVNGF